MRKLFTFFALAVMAFAAQAIEPSDFFIGLIGQDGYEVQYSLYLSPNNPNDYITMITFDPENWGTYDPNNEERPNVAIYFIVNGQRVGAEADMTPIVFGAEPNYQNPLLATDFCYTVPVGYVYTLGIHFADDGNMYVFVNQGPIPLVIDGVDELNTNKAVASVRYYNMAGQEMQQAEGPTIVVTTYTDGTTSAVKVVK